MIQVNGTSRGPSRQNRRAGTKQRGREGLVRNLSRAGSVQRIQVNAASATGFFEQLTKIGEDAIQVRLLSVGDHRGRNPGSGLVSGWLVAVVGTAATGVPADLDRCCLSVSSAGVAAQPLIDEPTDLYALVKIELAEEIDEQHVLKQAVTHILGTEKPVEVPAPATTESC